MRKMYRYRLYPNKKQLNFTQSGFSITHDHRVCLSKIGSLKMVCHRQIKGKVKTCTISRSSTGKWYVCFSVECEPERLPERPEQVAIDVGLATARVHERIKFRRDNFTHQNSRQIVDRFGVICVEDLTVNRMVHNHCLAKSISDAAWSQFFGQLSCKAEEAGRVFVKVNPAYTSQDCSRCHHRQTMPLSERTYHCPCCLLTIDRDLNAALNIRAVGLHSLGLALEAPAFTHGE
jgi:putative transposase